MSETITFRPTEAQGNFIQAVIEQGDYANQSEVIREGLRLLQERRAASKLKALRRLMAAGEADIKAGRVTHYKNPDDLLNSITK